MSIMHFVINTKYKVFLLNSNTKYFYVIFDYNGVFDRTYKENTNSNFSY